MAEIVYVYGTLRPGSTETVQIPGKLYDLGWFPGMIFTPLTDPDDNSVVCERLEVENLGNLDRYEGFSLEFPDSSFYIRRSMLDGWIYEFNQKVNPVKQIFSGDWLDYTQQERGTNAHYLC